VSALDAVTGLTNNVSVVRKALAVALSLAVQSAAVGAPLMHAHPDDHATAHHGARAVHTHWGGHSHSHHSTNVPAVDAGDHDRAVFLNAFVGVAAAVFPAGATVRGMFELPIPTEMAVHRPVEVAHGHDPPSFGPLLPRAPPLLLS
jgi:hypothetical protein